MQKKIGTVQKRGFMEALKTMLFAGVSARSTARGYSDYGSPIYSPPRHKLKGWEKAKRKK